MLIEGSTAWKPLLCSLLLRQASALSHLKLVWSIILNNFKCDYLVCFVVIFADWVPWECSPYTWKPWGCWYKCAIWFSPWMHWENGLDEYSYVNFAASFCESQNVLMKILFTGGEWWNMGVDTVQPTLQLSSSCCAYWKENHLYAWWHREINTFSGADREAWKAHNHGCWIYNSDGPSVVCFKYLYHFKVNGSLHYSFFT